MEPADSRDQVQCWVDVYELGYFMGRMRRLIGPKKLRQLSAKSVIVGPHAMVVLTVRRRGRDCLVKLPPKKVKCPPQLPCGRRKSTSVHSNSCVN